MLLLAFDIYYRYFIWYISTSNCVGGNEINEKSYYIWNL